jgi:hypothetical protein
MLQVRFNPDDIQFKTMKTMDHAARLAMMPDYEMYSMDLKEGAVVKLCHQTLSLELECVITRNNTIHASKLDGTTCLQFYYIDLFESVCRVIQDPTYADKLYHAF